MFKESIIGVFKQPSLSIGNEREKDVETYYLTIPHKLAHFCRAQ